MSGMNKDHYIRVLGDAKLKAALAKAAKKDGRTEASEARYLLMKALGLLGPVNALGMTVWERDQKIRRLAADGWSLREIAEEVDMHYASVSRIINGEQNRSGTGKGGRRATY